MPLKLYVTESTGEGGTRNKKYLKKQIYVELKLASQSF